VLTTALTCVSVAAQLAFVLTSFTSTSGLWLLGASAVCNLLVLGLSVVKMLLDAWELWSAVRQRARNACGCEAVSVDHIQSEEFTAVDAGIDAWDEHEEVAAPTNAARKTLLDVEEEAAEMIAFDNMFWDDDGQAIGTAEAEGMNEILTTVVEK
ncbi:membrane-associated protein, putative, partial [Bodo saltans]